MSIKIIKDLYNKVGGLGITSNKTASNSTNSNFLQKNKTVIIIIVVIILIFIVYKIYMKYNRSGSNKLDLLDKIHDGKVSKTIPGSDNFKVSQGNEINYNFWLFINDYRYNFDYDKVIFAKEDHLGSNHEVLLLRNSNIMRVVVKLQTSTQIIDSEMNDVKDVYYCDIPNIPLQKWININIAMHNNNIDIYIDGKLRKSCNVDGYPVKAKGKIKLCKDGGFNGFINKFVMYDKYLSVDKIHKLYKSGH